MTVTLNILSDISHQSWNQKKENKRQSKKGKNLLSHLVLTSKAFSATTRRNSYEPTIVRCSSQNTTVEDSLIRGC